MNDAVSFSDPFIRSVLKFVVVFLNGNKHIIRESKLTLMHIKR